ncbi:MAG: hypothetical protein KJ823_09105, partial [Proteobacteria bacterium]|nr:hypothetical protein [Pseudomonadota bacterium]
MFGHKGSAWRGNPKGGNGKHPASQAIFGAMDPFQKNNPTMPKPAKEDIFNLPNLLSLLRVGSIPL